ncbi:MAG: DUF616 domain-containing protein [Paracoccaceae bacterium]|nr:DUF616 domain-containing protein [Paracoccaceae bacterium]
MNIALYTAYFGAHEPLNPDVFGEAMGKLACTVFTDDPTLAVPDGATRVVLPRLGLDPARASRRPKLRPELYFEESDWAIYLDNNCRLLADPVELVERLVERGAPAISVMPHPKRAGIYEEIDECLARKKDSRARLLEQRRAYRALGVPERSGLFACNFIVYNLAAPQLAAFGSLWFEHVLAYSRRDQISLPVVARLMDLSPFPLDQLGLGALCEWPVFHDDERRRFAKKRSGAPALFGRLFRR